MRIAAVIALSALSSCTRPGAPWCLPGEPLTNWTTFHQGQVELKRAQTIESVCAAYLKPDSDENVFLEEDETSFCYLDVWSVDGYVECTVHCERRTEKNP